MPIVVASSLCVRSAIAVIARSPMRERRGPRTVVRIFGSRALAIFFPHTVGSSTRIGVCPVVIEAPTVRLAAATAIGCADGCRFGPAASSCSGPTYGGAGLQRAENPTEEYPKD